MSTKIGAAIVGQVEKIEHSPVFASRIRLEIVEHGDETAFAINEAEEALQMLSKEAGFPIIEKPRLQAAARDRAPGAALRHEVPGTVKLPHILVAVVE